MKSQPFMSLKALILSLGAEWDNTMQDVIPERGPLYYGSKDEVFTQDTHRRMGNHDTPDHWLLRYSKRYYSKKHDCWLTMAHCHNGTRDRLIGQLCTEEQKQYLKDWRENNKPKVQEANAKPGRKLKVKESIRSLRATEWMIDHDIMLTHHRGSTKVFQAFKQYKWTTLQNYYNGSTSSATADGWYKLE